MLWPISFGHYMLYVIECYLVLLGKYFTLLFSWLTYRCFCTVPTCNTKCLPFLHGVSQVFGFIALFSLLFRVQYRIYQPSVHIVEVMVRSKIVDSCNSRQCIRKYQCFVQFLYFKWYDVFLSLHDCDIALLTKCLQSVSLLELWLRTTITLSLSFTCSGT
jgi:hypothetical protein